MRENDGPITSISRLVFFCQFASVSTVSCKLFFVVSSRHGSLGRLKKRSFFLCASTSLLNCTSTFYSLRCKEVNRQPL